MCFYLLLLNIWKSLFSSASVDHSVTVFGFMVTEKYQQIKTSVRGAKKTKQHTLAVNMVIIQLHNVQTWPTQI